MGVIRAAVPSCLLKEFQAFGGAVGAGILLQALAEVLRKNCRPAMRVRRQAREDREGTRPTFVRPLPWFIDELGPPPNSPPSQISDMTYAEFHDVSRHAVKSAAGVLYLAPSVMQRLSFGLWSKQEPIADGTALPMTPTMAPVGLRWWGAQKELYSCCKSGAPPS